MTHQTPVPPPQAAPVPPRMVQSTCPLEWSVLRRLHNLPQEYWKCTNPPHLETIRSHSAILRCYCLCHCCFWLYLSVGMTVEDHGADMAQSVPDDILYTLGEGIVGMIQLNVDMFERERMRCQLDYVTVFHLEYGKTLRLTKDFWNVIKKVISMFHQIWF